MQSKNQVSGKFLSRAENAIRNNEARTDTCLPKYNYGNGYGWCTTRDSKRHIKHADIRRKGEGRWTGI
jgi:hypothetical protein